MKALYKYIILIIVLGCFVKAQSLTITPKTMNYGSDIIKWSEDYDKLTSWQLSFILQTTGLLSGGNLFQTLNYDLYYKSRFLSLQVNSDGTLKIYSDDVYFQSVEQLLFAYKKYSITLSYVTVTDNENSALFGEFTMMCGDNEVCNFVIDNSDKVGIAQLLNGPNYALLNTVNGYYKYGDVELTKLNDRIIPEPSGTVLFMSSVCCFMFHRRRR